ncbi:MAG: hypothetical protein HY901_33110 [Deltaproteobacteria bacterium]|nr:hypothetical protein [Deltaproteobacteria bacterium]
MLRQLVLVAAFAASAGGCRSSRAMSTSWDAARGERASAMPQRTCS